MTVGDPLGAGSRQDIRAALGAEYWQENMQVRALSREYAGRSTGKRICRSEHCQENMQVRALSREYAGQST